MTRKSVLIGLGAGLIVAACSGSTSSTDGGTTDSGAPDSGIVDAGAVDAGTVDAGSMDAGAIDAGPGDAGASDAGTVDAGAIDAALADAGVDCSRSPASFPTFDRACSVDSDCTIALHQINCCGEFEATGIDSSEAAAFAAAESMCESEYPRCGCAVMGTMTDDGSTAPPGTGASAVLVSCVSNVCTTTVRAPTACDGVTCASTQVCVKECSGIPHGDAGTSSVCVNVPSACATSSNCSCYGSASSCPSGQCESVSNGAPTCLCE